MASLAAVVALLSAVAAEEFAVLASVVESAMMLGPTGSLVRDPKRPTRATSAVVLLPWDIFFWDRWRADCEVGRETGLLLVAFVVASMPWGIPCARWKAVASTCPNPAAVGWIL